MAKYPYTVEDNLRAVNELRALSGDQPLSMERYLQNHENMKKGIYPWSDPAPKDFFSNVSTMPANKARLHLSKRCRNLSQQRIDQPAWSIFLICLRP
ncbi:hypothetical protein [Lacticaseibacillus manihotivorans]|uniref:hypothetical protein n=1 Tax=Lacticaseibacillus manihotivorans TaxID=88233 RepID=UPI000AF7F1A2|nr:hypothetical protein [Lacticaseibacillus manihotivorans]